MQIKAFADKVKWYILSSRNRSIPTVALRQGDRLTWRRQQNRTSRVHNYHPTKLQLAIAENAVNICCIVTSKELCVLSSRQDQVLLSKWFQQEPKKVFYVTGNAAWHRAWAAVQWRSRWRWTDTVWSLSQTLPQHNAKRLKSHHMKRTESYRRKEGEKSISSSRGGGWRETPEEFLSLRMPILVPRRRLFRGKRIF